jgi:enoyl-CoA hydratase/carnithine racemase
VTDVTLLVEERGRIAVLTLDRPDKRNAINSATVEALASYFRNPPPGVAAAVLTSSGDHFSAGLDLSELRETTAIEGVRHSRTWHAAFDAIQQGSIPVVSVLKGAVLGGGLELAVATHIRVAEASAYYALPEASRGIFVGGGASVRLSRLIGVHRMTDMMLTGRVLDAAEGQQLGISQYLVASEEGLEKALALAERIADNSPVSNYAVLQALPRIAEMSPNDGLFVESLMAAITQSSEESKQRLQDFLSGRAPKVVSGGEAPDGQREVPQS